jgi:hypothetical protein
MTSQGVATMTGTQHTETRFLFFLIAPRTWIFVNNTFSIQS